MPETPYQISDLQRRMDSIERKTEQVPVMARDISEIKDDVVDLRDETRALRRSLYTFALSVVGAALLFALTASHIFQ